MIRTLRLLATVSLITLCCAAPAAAQSAAAVDYRVLATSRTSTMEKEMNAAADAGYRFMSVMGGETAFGGKEVVTVMGKPAGDTTRYEYRLLATSRTSTMQKEMQAAADRGFEYVGQTVFESLFGGKEVVCILQRNLDEPARAKYEYRLLATNRTSTMQKELKQVGDLGFEVVGMTVGQTAGGGNELVTITRRPVK
jgi:hypothetical protein